MKQRKRIAGVAVVVGVVCLAAFFLFSSQEECFLCNCPAYSAPCLVDLETGNILELSMPGVADTPGAESNVETFSLIRFGSVTGTRQTAPDVIELKIPVENKLEVSALCAECRKLLQKDYVGRYVLADLSAPENKELIPLVNDAELSLKHYQLSMRGSMNQDQIIVTIHLHHKTPCFLSKYGVFLTF